MASFTIETPAEFSFRQCLHFLNRSPLEVIHTSHENHVEKFLKFDGQPVIFSVRERKAGQLQINFLHAAPTKEVKMMVRSYVEEWFDLRTDLKPFYKLAATNKILKPLIKKYFGYRVVSIPDLFESLCWATIGQQINLPFAYLLKQRFVQQFGEKFTFNDKVYYLFPASRDVSKLEPTQLLQLQFSRQKAAYVIGIAKAFVEGVMSKEKIAPLSFNEAKEELVKLKGVGNWTANYVLMKTFHYPNAFPIEDAGLHQAIRKQLKMKEKPLLFQIEKQFRNYTGWEAYATLYLWRSLGDE